MQYKGKGTGTQIINALVKTQFQKILLFRKENTKIKLLTLLSTWKLEVLTSETHVQCTPHSLLRSTVAINETVTCIVHIQIGLSEKMI